MRKSFFTVDFQNKETKTESSRPGLRSGVSVCQKGCEAPRTRTALKGLPQSEARDAKRGGPPKRVRSTEDEGLPQSEACDAKRGRPLKKGAKHRGRARRAAEAQSEARDAKRGRPQKGYEAPRTRTALKGLPQSEARDAKRGGPQKGCEAPRTRTALKGLPQSEARDAKRGGPPKRVRSTEDEDGPERATAVRSTRRKAGRAAKKGAKHRGRARRAAAAQSEACDAKRGRPPKRVRSP